MIKELKNLTQAYHLIAIAKQVYNADPMIKTGNRMNVFARTAISVQLLANGEKNQYIGDFLNKDHSTIIHIVKQHPDRLKYDQEYKELYFKFLAEIGKSANHEQLTRNEVKFQVSRLTKELLKLNFSFDEITTFWQNTINECKTQQS
jgi:IS30 family transposase